MSPEIRRSLRCARRGCSTSAIQAFLRPTVDVLVLVSIHPSFGCIRTIKAEWTFSAFVTVYLFIWDLFKFVVHRQCTLSYRLRPPPSLLETRRSKPDSHPLRAYSKMLLMSYPQGFASWITCHDRIALAIFTTGNPSRSLSTRLIVGAQ